jgi:ribose transport system substrate-binding protein
MTSSVYAATIKVGAMPADPKVAFFTRMAKGFRDAAKELGVQVDIQYPNRDIQEELRLTEAFIAAGMNGVIINTVDSKAVTGPLSKAKAAGVPMVAIDTVPDQLDLAVSTVTSDNYAGGVAAAKVMRKLLNDKGDVIMTEFQYRSIAMDDRYRGFRDGLKGSRIKIVDTLQQNGTREDTLAKISPMLAKYPNLKGIFCSQGDPAIGALAAVDASKKSNSIVIVSYDIEDEVAAAIKRGSAIKGGVTQFPYEMGWRAMAELVKAIKGETPEKLVKIPVLPVTRDNVDLLMKDSTAFLQRYGNFKIR